MASREDGFAAIEMVVGVIVLMMVVTAALSAVAQSKGYGQRSSTDWDTLAVASEAAARVGLEVTLHPGVTSGETNGIQWSVDIRPFEFNLIQSRGGLFSVRVQASRRGHKPINLHTLQRQSS